MTKTARIVTATNRSLASCVRQALAPVAGDEWVAVVPSSCIRGSVTVFTHDAELAQTLLDHLTADVFPVTLDRETPWDEDGEFSFAVDARR